MRADVNQVLDYAATHPDAVTWFSTSDMQLHIHSDASYLNEPGTWSWFGGHFYLRKNPMKKISTMEQFTTTPAFQML
jgi:hypothetical protein